MARTFRHLAIALLILLVVTRADAQWEQTNGPHTGTAVYAMTSYNGSLLACAKVTGYSNGLYQSSDGGETWALLTPGLTLQKVQCFAECNGILFAGTNEGLYASANGGINWYQPDTTLPTKFVHTIICVPSRTGEQVLFVGFAYEGVYRSTDNGMSWTALNNGLANLHVHALLYEESLMLAATQIGIFRSSDGGANWSPSSTGIDGLTIWRLLAVPGTPDGTVYLAGSYDYGLYRSTDRGVSWVHVDGGFPSYKVSSMAFDGTYIFAGTEYQDTYRSGDNGNTWKKIDESLESSFVTQFLFEYQNLGDRLFASTARGVYVTSDRGESWAACNKGFPMQYIISFASHEGILYAGTQSAGVYRSTDNGDHWTTVNRGIEEASVEVLETVGSTIYAAARNDVYRSTDRGETWIPSESGVADDLIYAIESVGELLYAGTRDGIYVSTDGSRNWKQQGNVFADKWVQALAVTGGGRVLIAGTTQRRTEETGLYRSTNGGITWEHATTDPPDLIIYDIDTIGRDTYAASWTFPLRSTNDGVTWTRLPFPLNDTYLYDLEVVGTNLFAVTWYDGIFVSSNRGYSWTKITGEFKHPYIFKAHAHNGYLFAGIDSRGVWRRRLSDMVVGTDAVANAVESARLLQNYPNPVASDAGLTAIPYTIATPDRVVLTVHNTLGMRVATLVDGHVQAGTHTAEFFTAELPPGVYTYRLRTNNSIIERRCIVLR